MKYQLSFLRKEDYKLVYHYCNSLRECQDLINISATSLYVNCHILDIPNDKDVLLHNFEKKYSLVDDKHTHFLHKTRNHKYIIKKFEL